MVADIVSRTQFERSGIARKQINDLISLGLDGVNVVPESFSLTVSADVVIQLSESPNSSLSGETFDNHTPSVNCRMCFSVS